MAIVTNFWVGLSLGLLGIVYLAGFLALVYCAKRAPEGYEDAHGFRLGSQPAPPLQPPRAEDGAGVESVGRIGHPA